MSAELMPVVGEIPDPLPFEPGETQEAPPRHYPNRKKGESGPICGEVETELTPYARNWKEVTCNECVANRPERGRKPKEARTEQKEEPKKARTPGPNEIPLESMLSVVLSRTINVALYANKRPPAPPEPLDMFSANVVRAMEHYDLLQHAGHPLAGVVLSGAILAWAISDLPEITDQDKLDKLHGMPDVQS